ncbi:MAG: SAM-dependent methyltransferase [Microbacterium sp. 67-17]|uniref:class I SAM-dependent methyltransferase n=1 Tax=Microbacterium sp. 67-17 TaxID=1895782 RepID=UPI00095D9277|nr:methyltransferase [Microbacterium sp. 67-17]OJV98930.1 MAG: SAM-dependent methyltransferase [Microbacterium sp. 67-17]
MTLDLDALRPFPDAGDPDRRAHDAADRLLLDESADARRGLARHEIAVIGDTFGALALACASDAADGVVRVHQDSLGGERTLTANARSTGLEASVESLPLDAEVVRGARVVLVRLPRSLEALRDVAGLIAAHAAPDVVVFAGGRIKHMSLGMNDVLREHFDTVDVSHARQKSRVLIARGPHGGRDPEPSAARQHIGDTDVEVRAFGGVFAGATLDIGTRLLLDNLPETIPGQAVDLACGNGVVGATLALRHPGLRVYASDESAAAVASARATAAANGIGDRMTVVRDDALSTLPDASASFIALNPPFHRGAAIDETIARHLFADAARVLRPGGELWTVWNSALRYRPSLEKVVGPTRQIARTPKFTVTASTRR